MQRARAIWNGVTLACSDRVVMLEGNAYFPAEDVRDEHRLPLEGCRALLQRRGRGTAQPRRGLVLPQPEPLGPQDQRARGVLAWGAGGDHRARPDRKSVV